MRIVGCQGFPDLIQAEAKLLEVFHPADITDLVIVVIAVSGFLICAARSDYPALVIKPQSLRRNV